uniref:Uncharacterized protein n=1 Tax=Lygus hesperus TaxID=30085 RepID=A0A0A9WJX0_LYGHE
MLSSKNTFAVFMTDGNVVVVENRNASATQFSATLFAMKANVRLPGVRFSRTVDFAFVLFAETKRIRMFQFNLSHEGAGHSATMAALGAITNPTAKNVSASPPLPVTADATVAMTKNSMNSGSNNKIADPAILSAAAAKPLTLNTATDMSTSTINFAKAASNSPVKTRIASPSGLNTGEKPASAITGLIQQLERGNLKPFPSTNTLSPTNAAKAATTGVAANTKSITSKLMNSGNSAITSTDNNCTNVSKRAEGPSPSSLTKLMKNVTVPTSLPLSETRTQNELEKYKS